MTRARLSLRLKLTLWFLAIFTVVFMGVGLAASVLHSGATRQALDERLLVHADGVAANLEKTSGKILPYGLQRFQPTDRTFVLLAVRDGNGEVLAVRSSADADALPPLSAAEEVGGTLVRPLSGDQARRLLGGAITSRMVTHRVMMPDESVRYIDLATTIDFDAEDRSFVQDVFVVGGIAALIAAALAAWLIAGRAVAPMTRLTAAAAHLQPENLSARIDVEGEEIEVERLQRTLNEALARLQEAYRAQERFIGNVAHDLKTPIAVMLTESQVLRPGSVSLEEYEQYRRSVIDEMRRLGGLVESFLTLARADRGDLLDRVCDVSMVDVILEAVSECDGEAASAGVRLVPSIDDAGEVEGFGELRGDPDLLRTMLINLIRNAVRHSPSEASVEIRLTHDRPDIEVSVRDHGPGVPDEFVEAIFDRFVQVRSDPARGKGTGLGLAIARTVAEVHGGAIGVRNCPDAGCVFTVVLPPAGAGDRSGAASAEEDEAASAMSED